jgi:hypothetical protein
VIDPIDIRLNVIGPAGSGLAGRTLAWDPSQGWSLSRPGAALAFFAGPAATPMDLAPTPANLMDWVADGAVAAATPPAGVELDDDPVAVGRLLGFIDLDRRIPLFHAFAPDSSPSICAEPRPPTTER